LEAHYKGQIGDVMEIRATDDLGLAELNVKIVAQDGTPIESGQAVEEGVSSGKWIYTTTAQVALGSDVFIEVKGCDHAGNKAQITENPTVEMDE
jgi:ABC-type sugar transport system substrate-binding protein